MDYERLVGNFLIDNPSYLKTLIAFSNKGISKAFAHKPNRLG